MTRWEKDTKHGGFSKTAKLPDGAIISLLLSGEGRGTDETLEQCYASYCEIDDAPRVPKVSATGHDPVV